MIPAAYIALSAIPLTTSAKINYRALPAPDDDHWAKAGIHIPPGTPNETLLTGIWADLLGHGAISVHDDFFGIGGHSLLATQLASRVGQAFEVDLPLHIVFEHPTVARQAQYIDALLVGTNPSHPDTVQQLTEDRI